jgi:hydrogenase small subunit
MGCKGPATFQNCPNVRWNGGTNWPIGCGHPCIGCAEPDFWDRMTPFYQHLTGVPGFGAASNVDTIGAIAALGVGAAFAGHGLIQIMKRVGTRAEPIARSNDRNADERRGGPSGPPETSGPPDTPGAGI